MKIAAFMINAFLAIVAVVIIFPPTVYAVEPDVLLYPTHVVMTDRHRTAQVDIVNNSQMQATYKIRLVRKRMTESGGFKNISTAAPGEKFADEVVKFSPRQVTLVPGAGQTVRIMFKASPTLAEGEYRSHLEFAKLPSGINQLPTNGVSDASALSMRIIANIGVSIPVIARHGKLDAKAAIDPLSVKVLTVDPKQQLVQFALTRTGTRSIYGGLVVYRDAEIVAIGKGFSVYTPNSRRMIELRVLEPYQLRPGDKVRITFTENDEKKPMAETTIVLP